ncbi:protein of unknown function [Paenimyroides ummariense]|uniref:DUF4468 domain-containing protein n=1 Tax=Paenimyroides ummariense TaxID=913024 RepID=A0A1I5E2P0_9FLAO|nr:DUF4468 domain-containing protein [Paenimyroides ummariense]SFO05613.1 protein of unknown function [Paenimyroides ummariense]
MKQTLLFLLLVSGVNISFAQIAFSGKEFQNTIITSCENKTAEEMYQKALNWISYTFNSPNDVLMAKIENEYIRFEGAKEHLVCWETIGTICNNGKFTVELSFKDGRYKFELIKLQQYIPYTGYGPHGWDDVNFEYVTANMYKNNGKLRPKYQHFISDMPEYFNNLNKQLQQFIQNENIPSKREDW